MTIGLRAFVDATAKRRWDETGETFFYLRVKVSEPGDGRTTRSRAKTYGAPIYTHTVAEEGAEPVLADLDAIEAEIVDRLREGCAFRAGVAWVEAVPVGQQHSVQHWPNDDGWQLPPPEEELAKQAADEDLIRKDPAAYVLREVGPILRHTSKMAGDARELWKLGMQNLKGYTELMTVAREALHQTGELQQQLVVHELREELETLVGEYVTRDRKNQRMHDTVRPLMSALGAHVEKHGIADFVALFGGVSAPSPRTPDHSRDGDPDDWLDSDEHRATADQLGEAELDGLAAIFQAATRHRPDLAETVADRLIDCVLALHRMHPEVFSLLRVVRLAPLQDTIKAAMPGGGL